jgi:hypothetical protein
VVHLPSLATKQNVHAPIPVAYAYRTDILDAPLEAGLIGSTRTVVVGRGVHFQNPAGTPDRHIPFPAHRIDELALATRP